MDKFYCQNKKEYNELSTLLFNTQDDAIRNLFSANIVYEFSAQSFLLAWLEAKDMLGNDWVQIHKRIVQQHVNQNKRLSWSKSVSITEFQQVEAVHSHVMPLRVPPPAMFREQWWRTGTRLSTCCLKNFIKGHNGKFLTASCVSL
ncbi:unnamed protein product [Cuscuta epithymum]|uniref:Uncharacterized protein n=1 Tax=Cuscuta epithymum TaxID=186058 RepID=A0AAV0CDF6_9ASTE|nr:unnamed protein product [Cuscuta epithymum]